MDLVTVITSLVSLALAFFEGSSIVRRGLILRKGVIVHNNNRYGAQRELVVFEANLIIITINTIKYMP